MTDAGKALLVAGVALVVVGASLVLAERLGWPRLPGDFVWRRDNVRIYVPIATSVALSVLLTILFHFVSGRR